MKIRLVPLLATLVGVAVGFWIGDLFWSLLGDVGVVATGCDDVRTPAGSSASACAPPVGSLWLGLAIAAIVGTLAGYSAHRVTNGEMSREPDS